ncbi:MAG TPA: hypothetical protein VFW75_07015 [Acetobacteraceae bacterium]|nr:hypothetical protein [Acetobacteraceae bacterium]
MMKMRWTMPLLALLALGPAVPGWAQQRPATRPSEDVAAAYRVQATKPTGETEAHTIRMYWTGHGNHLRLEVDGQSSFELIDFATSRATLVLPVQKSYMVVPFDPQHAPGLDIPPDATVTRRSSDSIAGTPCTVWEMRGPQGGGTACIAADGLVLQVRGLGAGPPALEAISVAYGPQPANLFEVPTGLHPLKPR